MTLNALTLAAADLVAIAVLSLAIYFPRHHRRDLVVAFTVVNVGVLAAAFVLASTEVGVGLGLGLFGVLSIIRLRSSEISQREVAYYFAALALGLVAGIPTTAYGVHLALMGLVLAVIWGADHPRLLAGSRQQVVTLDRAIGDEAELRSELAALLGARIDAVSVERLDLVRDLTVVDVRYRLEPVRRPGGAGSAGGGAPAGAAWRTAEADDLVGVR